MLRKMHRRKLNKKGFTLIEVIVSLVLIGIMAAIAGMGLVKIAEGYVFAKQNAETAQKAQIAIARIVKELGAVCPPPSTSGCLGITAASGTSVTYTRAESSISPTPVTNNIMLSGSTVKIGLLGAETTLIDGVTGFTLAYFNAAGTDSIATPANIRRIDITLTLSGANNTSMPFNKISVFMQEAY
jgi:prepilin-type N-terminal cleavage/methylation domain-containing protein